MEQTLLEETYIADVENEKFVIDNDDKAEWAADMIARRQARINKVEARAREKIEAIKKLVEEQTKGLKSDIAHFEAMLRPYAEQELKRMKKGKTVPLLNGAKLKFTKAADDFDYDDDMLLEFLQAGGEDYKPYIKVKESPAWSEFKKACSIVERDVLDGQGNVIETEKKLVTALGEVVECVKITPAGKDKFSVDVKGCEVE